MVPAENILYIDWINFCYYFPEYLAFQVCPKKIRACLQLLSLTVDEYI